MWTVFPSTINVMRSPLATPRTSRISFGIVICPLGMTLALSTNVFANTIAHLLVNTKSRDFPTSIYTQMLQENKGIHTVYHRILVEFSLSHLAILRNEMMPKGAGLIPRAARVMYCKFLWRGI